MEQPTIFSLLLICGVFLSASASPLIPEDKIPQQLPENPWPEAEEEENATVVNEDKSPAAIEESLPGSFYGRASYTLEDILAELEISNSSSRMEEIMDPGKKRVARCATCSSSPAYGGGGGTAFAGPCRLVAAIKELKVCSNGEVIQSIRAKYKYTDESTAWAAVRGTKCTREHHIILQPGEKISAVFGYADRLVRMLTFLTSTSSEFNQPYRRVFGPYGSLTTGDLFAVNSDIVAFFGRSGALLDSIGFFIHG